MQGAEAVETPVEGREDESGGSGREGATSLSEFDAVLDVLSSAWDDLGHDDNDQEMNGANFALENPHIKVEGGSYDSNPFAPAAFVNLSRTVPKSQATRYQSIPTSMATANAAPKLSSDEAREWRCAVIEAEQHDGLNSSDADWFLEVLETYYEGTLTPEQKQQLDESQLRAKRKHRHSVTFEDDRRLIADTPREIPVVQGDSAGRHLVREACKVIVQVFQNSLAPRDSAIQGCVWSAMMDRVRFHIARAGYYAEVKKGQSRNNEATLFVEGYAISRSNLRKVIKDCQDSLGLASVDENNSDGDSD